MVVLVLFLFKRPRNVKIWKNIPCLNYELQRDRFPGLLIYVFGSCSRMEPYPCDVDVLIDYPYGRFDLGEVREFFLNHVGGSQLVFASLVMKRWCRSKSFQCRTQFRFSVGMSESRSCVSFQAESTTARCSGSNPHHFDPSTL